MELDVGSEVIECPIQEKGMDLVILNWISRGNGRTTFIRSFAKAFQFLEELNEMIPVVRFQGIGREELRAVRWELDGEGPPMLQFKPRNFPLQGRELGGGMEKKQNMRSMRSKSCFTPFKASLSLTPRHPPNTAQQYFLQQSSHSPPKSPPPFRLKPRIASSQQRL